MRVLPHILFIFFLGFTLPLFAQCSGNCFLDIIENRSCDKNTITLEANTNGKFVGWFENGLLLSKETLLTITPAGQTLKAVSSDSTLSNLIVNGDFENGFSNFTSDYDFTPMVDSLFNNGDFNITTNPAELSAFAEIEDHTGNGGNMLIADASKFDYKAVYESKVNVTKGNMYQVSLWATNIHQLFVNKPDSVNYNSAVLGVYIDSTFIESINLPQDISWNQLSFEWLADTTGEVELAIKSLNTSKEQNDFALDDIQFSGITTFEKEITLTPCNNSKEIDVFSPDGDGNYDTFPILEEGLAKIYNVDGFLIQELQAPTTWNGLTNQGAPAPVGYYIIIVDNKFVKKVSLLK